MSRNSIIAEDLQAVLSALSPLCSELEERKIFLTGGTGFFGKWLLHSLLALRREAGVDVSLTILSRAPNNFLKANAEFGGKSGLDFVSGDVRTFDFTGLPSFDYIIHGATPASANLDREDSDEMFSVITEGTRHILDFTRRCSAKRLLFISSGAVYGRQPSDMTHIPEAYEGIPSTAYGKGKKISEEMCLDASLNTFDCVIARPFAFVGPYLPLDTHFAIGNFIRDCLENRDIVIQGDGTPLRSYLYAADLAVWLWTLLVRSEHGKAYNVGSSEAISIGDLAALVKQCAGCRNEIRVHGVKKEGALPAPYVPSVAQACAELGLAPKTALSVAVRRTIDWHRSLRLKGSCG